MDSDPIHLTSLDQSPLKDFRLLDDLLDFRLEVRPPSLLAPPELDVIAVV